MQADEWRTIEIVSVSSDRIVDSPQDTWFGDVPYRIAVQC